MPTMYIVHISPLTKQGTTQLSYYSATAFEPGSIVRIPLRKKEVLGVVISSDDVRSIKTELRMSDFETKKIATHQPLYSIPSHLFSAYLATARHFACAPGKLIRSFLPAAISELIEKGVLDDPRDLVDNHPGFERFVLQLPRKERFEKYRTFIRTHLAQGRSVYVCVPTTREARALREEFSRGIEKYIYVLESSLTKKQQQKLWDEILTEPHPLCIIGTPLFASIPRHDIGTYLIENEISSAYKQQQRPHADARILIEHIARATESTLVYAGTIVGLSAQKLLQEDKAIELEEHARKLRTSCRLEIIDSKATRAHAKELKLEFPVLSPDAIHALLESTQAQEHSFVFTARRGIASQTTCNDCGTTVKCMRCKSPMILHGSGSNRELLCHRCGSSRSANETCNHCDSWNLAPLGVGIERVVEFVKARIPEATVCVISSDATTTPAQARLAAERFYGEPGAILIGTEMALPYLSQKVTHSVVSSIDSLLCIPDFRIEEKIFSILLALQESTEKKVFVETSSPENVMLKYAKSGSIDEYAQEELRLREQLHYPPYTHFVKVTCTGPKDTVIADMQTFVDLTREYRPHVFSNFTPVQRGTALQALIRIPITQWPDDALIQKLQSLPYTFDVEIDPERTL